MTVRKIVITGGPCAGKTEALGRVREVFTRLGYTVLVIPETATQLISGGVAPWTCGTPDDFQRCLARLQLAEEQAFEQAAATMSAEKLLIVCDRGMLDCKCYMSDADFTALLRELDLTEEDALHRYDAVFHLVTAACGAAEHYSLASNSARMETAEQAVVLDRRLVSCWSGHPFFRMVDNSTDFEGKLLRLIREICLFLGEPEPVEIERKFLIRHPDTAWLNSLPGCDHTDIVQTYLSSGDGSRERVRCRGRDGSFVYSHTVKRFGSGITRMEIERIITLEEYEQLLDRADPDFRPLHKTRYCLEHGGKCFEIDLYPFWSDRAVMEVELKSEDEHISFPDGFEIIREVSDDPEYSNYSLARR